MAKQRPDAKNHPRTLTPNCRIQLEDSARVGLTNKLAAQRSRIAYSGLAAWLAQGVKERAEGLKPRAFDRELRRWAKPSKRTSVFVELLDAMEAARGDGAEEALMVIRKAALGQGMTRVVTTTEADGSATVRREDMGPDWRAAVALLERTHPVDYPRQQPETPREVVPVSITYRTEVNTDPNTKPVWVGAPVQPPKQQG